MTNPFLLLYGRALNYELNGGMRPGVKEIPSIGEQVGQHREETRRITGPAYLLSFSIPRRRAAPYYCISQRNKKKRGEKKK